MLKIGNLHLTLKIAIEVSIWNAKITKTRNGRQAERMSDDMPESNFRREL